ncbi:MAG: VOC family protein [Caulobacterales bacterium]|jgi:catechol 2,3-dioxygenase-like lactoylglutathione lyase family enzyme
MRLAHVTIDVSDIGRSKAFYVGVGFELLVDAAHYCRFNIGGATLSIHGHEGPITPAAEVGIVFESAEALDAFVAGLIAKGFAVSLPVDQSWLWREARVLDPDGHTILLMFAGENHLNPPWRVG